jgi:hypothetical protein
MWKDHINVEKSSFGLNLPSPMERVLKKSEIKVLSFGEDYSLMNCFLLAFMSAAQFR